MELADLCELVIPCLAFLGVVLLVAGIWGQPDQSRPVCRVCKADARPSAWTEPLTCVCGAALDRPGAVRTKGRVRRPWRSVVGAVLLVAGCLLAWDVVRLAKRRMELLDRLPLAALRVALEQEYEWAGASLERRLEAKDLDAADAASLLRPMLVPLPGGGAKLQLNQAALAAAEWIDPIFDRWSEGSSMGDPLLDLLCTCQATEAAAAHAAGEALVDLRIAPADQCTDQWGLRIEAIRVDGTPVDRFQYEGSKVESAWGWRRTSRPESSRLVSALDRGAIRIPLPDDDRATGHVVEIDGLLIRSPAFLQAFGDALVDGTAPPAEWGVWAHCKPITLRVELSAKASRGGPEGQP